MPTRCTSLLIATLILTLIATGCQPVSPPTPTPSTSIRLPLGYIPNVQFAPLYVAAEKGYFAKHGIQIEFDYIDETDAVRLVGSGELQFAVVSGEQVLLARQQDVPIVYVFEWYQRYPVGVVAKHEQGIRSVSDLAGRSVGIPVTEGASYIGLRALLASGGLSESDLTLETIGYTQVAAISEDTVDAAVIYVPNEPVQLRAAGFEVDVIAVSDYADLVGNGLITNQDTIRDNPDLVAAMVDALYRGVEDSINSPDEAFEICKKVVEGLGDPEVAATQMQVLQESIKLWEAERLGWSDTAAWLETQDVLMSMGLLSEPLDVEQAFTNQFLPYEYKK
jgi:NitT/TauT family transport system substrate-binding protein